MKRSSKNIYPLIPSSLTYLFLLFVLLILQQPHNTIADVSNNTSDKSNTAIFAWVSDLHYDPFYGAKDAYSHSSAICGNGPQNHNANNTTTNTTAKKVPSRGKTGCDSPSSLIEMTLLAIKDKIQQYHFHHSSSSNDVSDVILLTGDLVRHSTDKLPDPKKSMSETLSYLAKLLRFTFPNPSNIIPVIGNNDVTPDYYLDVDFLEQKQEMEEENENGEPEEEMLPSDEGAEKKETGLDILYKAFENVLITEEEEKISFQNSGYYMRKIENTNINIMVLNTVIYSPFHKPNNYVQDEEDPLQQFAWMEIQLHNLQYQNVHNNLKGKQVCWIVGHIPPTIGSYRKTQLWKDSYLIQYHRLIYKYKDVVVTQMFGHLHSDEFRLLSPTSTMLDLGVDDATNETSSEEEGEEVPTPPILMQGSITPVFGSNPNFRIVTYDTVTGSILDYDVYHINIEEGSTSTWEKLYSFKEYYNIADEGDVSTQILEPLYTRMKYENGENAYQTTLLEKFLNVHFAKPKPSVVQEVEDETGEDFEYGTPEDECKDQCKVEWMCTLTSMSRKDYDNCVSPSSSTTTTQPEEPSSTDGNKNGANHVRFIFLAIACGIFLVFFCTGTCCQAYRRRELRRQYEDVANEFNLDANDLTLYERQNSSSSMEGSNSGGVKGSSTIESSRQRGEEEEGFENEEDSQEQRNQQVMLSDDMELL